MHETDNQAARAGCDRKGQHVRWGISRSIRPGVPVPATLLVADMGDGEFLLQGWRAGPSAYLTAQDAGPLRQALRDAFGNEPVDDETAVAGSSEVTPTQTPRP